MYRADDTKGHSELVHNRIVLKFDHERIMAKKEQMAIYL